MTPLRLLPQPIVYRHYTIYGTLTIAGTTYLVMQVGGELRVSAPGRPLYRYDRDASTRPSVQELQLLASLAYENWKASAPVEALGMV